jgi:hypothetical protein
MQLQLISAKGTAINTTLAALAAVSGDSLAIPNFDVSKNAWLLQVWADVQAAGTLRIRSPKWHDNVNGILIDTVASDATPLLPWGYRQRVYPGDNLIVELAGSATAGDEEFVSMLLAYEDLPGQQGQLWTPEQVQGRLSHVLTVENTITTLTTGVYTGAEAINAEIDQFQTDMMYAILGYKVDTECAAVRWRSPSWANTGVGGPGIETEAWLTSDWFSYLSERYKLPLIPVFSGNDKASVLVDALQDENGADVTVTTFLAAMRRG